jgi:V8-like Glu-specific endopeptidase
MQQHGRAGASPGAAASAWSRGGRRTPGWPIAAGLALAQLFIASASAGQAGAARGAGLAPRLPEPVAVFGRDDRVAVPARFKDLQQKIGLLFNRRSRMVCTAFCVAPNVVATAGHCLHRTHGEPHPQLADFWFARNYDAERHFERIAGSGNGAAAQHVMSGTMDLRVRPPIDASRDWALVRLSRPACSRGVLAIRALSSEAIIAEAAAKHIFQVSYHRDFMPWKLAYSQPCSVARSFETADWATIARDFADPTHLLLHTCDTGGASSGSPLLLETGDGLQVVGINVGTYVQTKVLMENGQVTKRLKADAVANTAVNSSVFAAKLSAFRQAAILSSPAQIRQLQTALKERELYAGSIDGSYGAALRAAIEAYERARGIPVTGLASEALLLRLNAEGRRPAAARGS